MHNWTISTAPFIKNFLGVFGLVCIFYSFIKLNKSTPFPGVQTFFPVFGAALLVASGPNSWINRNLLSLRPLRFFGLISFPLYLWHWPIFSYLRIILGEPSTLILTTATAASIALATATFYTVENFLRFERGKIHWRGPLLISTLCAFVFLLKFYRIDSMYSDSQTATLKSSFSPHPCSKLMTLEGLKKLDYCLVSSKSPPKIAIIGDSHAQHLFRGFAVNYRDPVLLAGSHSCPPIIVNSYYISNCISKNKFLLKFFGSKESADIHSVILGFFYGYAHEVPYAADHVSSGTWGTTIAINKSLARADKEDSFEKGLSEFALSIANAGKSVYIVRDIPEMPFLPNACLTTVPSREAVKRKLGIEPGCSIPLSEYTNRQNSFHTMYERIAAKHPNIYIVDAAKPLCNKQSCSMLIDGKLVYRDSHHLNDYGSEIVSNIVINEMDQFANGSTVNINNTF